MNVILLHNDHRHVSVTNMAIFRMVSAKLQIYLKTCTYYSVDGHMGARNMPVVIM